MASAFVAVCAFFTILIGYFVIADGCESAWLRYQSSCYHFSHDNEQWEVAQMVCRDLGGHLVEIETRAEDNFLTTEVVRRGESFWIGASDLLIENEWRWMTSKTQLSYTNWGPGNPSHQDPSNLGDDENCAEIDNDVSKWNDLACDSSQKYICERSTESEIIG